MSSFDTAVRQAAKVLGPEHAAGGLAWDTAPPGTGLPEFRYEFSGVRLDWLGCEASVIALGHIPAHRFRAACNSLFLSQGRPAPGTRTGFFSGVRHLHAVHARGSTPARWRLYRDADQDTPGAFPVTTYGPGW